VEVIGTAFTAKAAGAGHRQIAQDLGRAPETVRGWLRRLGGRLEAVRAFFTTRLVAVAIEPGLPEPRGSAWGDAVAAVASSAAAIVARFGAQMVTVTVWQAAAAATGGALLTPGWGLPGSGRAGNTS
jgi:transposase